MNLLETCVHNLTAFYYHVGSEKIKYTFFMHNGCAYAKVFTFYVLQFDVNDDLCVYLILSIL